jgi:acetylornithine/succinyldiaminopimelate/putrescine aminotransferase
MLARKDVADAFTPGSHASTFGGTPIATAAALAVMQVFERDNIPARALETGAYFEKQLRRLKDKHDRVEDVRGKGLLLGLRLKTPGAPIVTACMENGFLINCIQDNILRFIPPLVISRDDIDALIGCLNAIL